MEAEIVAECEQAITNGSCGDCETCSIFQKVKKYRDRDIEFDMERVIKEHRFGVGADDKFWVTQHVNLQRLVLAGKELAKTGPFQEVSK